MWKVIGGSELALANTPIWAVLHRTQQSQCQDIEIVVTAQTIALGVEFASGNYLTNTLAPFQRLPSPGSRDVK
jgi:hypothetical protein